MHDDSTAGLEAAYRRMVASWALRRPGQFVEGCSRPQRFRERAGPGVAKAHPRTNRTRSGGST